MCITSCTVCSLLFLLHKTLRTAKGCCTRCACNIMDARVTSIRCLVENLIFQAPSSTLCMISATTGMYGNQVRHCCVNYESVKQWCMGKHSRSFMLLQPGERPWTKLHHVATALCFIPSRPARENLLVNGSVTSLLSTVETNCRPHLL